jgi:hypothetical protein
MLSFFINDFILSANKKGNTFNEFVDTYNVNINFVECYGIINALSNNWNQFIMGEIIQLDRICNKIVVNVKAENKSLTDFL